MIKYFTMCAALFTLCLTTQASAKECKGQAMTSCKISSSCSWVKSYKKKDNTKVSGFCRSGNKKMSKKSTKKKYAKSNTKKSKNKKIAKNIKTKKKPKSKNTRNKIKVKKKSKSKKAK